MNKKIKIYSTLMIVTIVVLVLSSFNISFGVERHETSYMLDEKLYIDNDDSDFVVSRVSKDSVIVNEDGSKDTIKITNAQYKPTFSIELFVQPKSESSDPFLHSHVGLENQDYKKITMKMIKITMPYDNINKNIKNVEMYGHLPTMIVNGIICIFILCVVFKLVKRIRKGEVFTNLLSRDLDKVGKLLILSYAVNFLSSYLLYLYFSSEIKLAYYEIAFCNSADSMLLIMGFVLMILSQIILMGKDMKEENDLTI